MRSAYIVFRVGCDAADSVTATGPDGSSLRHHLSGSAHRTPWLVGGRDPTHVIYDVTLSRWTTPASSRPV